VKVSQSFLQETAENSNGVIVSDLPHIFEVIENVYLPQLLLPPATTTVVFHELYKRIGEDPSTWTAVLMPHTGEGVAHYEDLLL
jgi:hypothetical protein